MTLELFWPVKPAPVNQRFGVNGAYYREHGIDIDGHNGIDFGAPHGTPVRAAHDGIAYVSKDDREGWGVVVRTHEPREFEGGEYHAKTIYWHFATDRCHGSAHKIPVVTGQRVRCGDVIGYANNTGLSTGDHLHFGLKPQAWDEDDFIWINPAQDNGYLGAVDPMPFFGRIAAEDYQGFRRKLAELFALLGTLFKGRNPSPTP